MRRREVMHIYRDNKSDNKIFYPDYKPERAILDLYGKLAELWHKIIYKIVDLRLDIVESILNICINIGIILNEFIYPFLEIRDIGVEIAEYSDKALNDLRHKYRYQRE